MVSWNNYKDAPKVSFLFERVVTLIQDGYPRLHGKYGLGENISDRYLINLANEMESVPIENKDEAKVLKMLIGNIYIAIKDKENHYDKYMDMLIETMNESKNLSNDFLINLAIKMSHYRRNTKMTDDEGCYCGIIRRKILEKVKL